LSRRDQASSKLLTPAQLAERLGVSVRYVYQNANKLPGCRRLSPRLLRFESSEVEEWIAGKAPDPNGPSLLANP
jgi:excisionase family DNA binding protein